MRGTSPSMSRSAVKTPSSSLSRFLGMLVCLSLILLWEADNSPQRRIHGIGHLVHGFQQQPRRQDCPTLSFRKPPRCRHTTANDPRRSKSSSHPSSTALRLSIDDPWEELASSLGTAASLRYVDAQEVLQALSSAQWYDAFSREWFHAVSQAGNNALALYAQWPLPLQIGLLLTPATALLGTALYSLSHPPDNYRSNLEPYLRGEYDPIQAQAYYNRKPLLLVRRSLQMLRLANRFLLGLALDKYVWKTEEQNRNIRATQLLQVITQLGPTAIKVGQALSVRQDLIPSEYAAALSTLQDQVPPFDSALARTILVREWGPEKYGRLKFGNSNNYGNGGGAGREPVASASIGQVYKAVVDDTLVAVKVQRPNVLAEIALDLHLVRQFAPIYQKLTRTGTDLQGLADEWGRGFVAELDYRREAASTTRFTEEMRRRNLNAVCAPTVLPEFSTEQILVTEWVDGTRIDQSSDVDDIPRLCSVALNAYLVMLLELQSLHCDPHPGNLLRTKDGKLCILDFGMTLDIDPNLQYSLLEYVAHLTAENYDSLPEDFVKLGFLKEEKLEFARRSGVLEPLKYFLRQLSEGGGADAVRDRIFSEYRDKYQGLSDDELRVEMRAEMKTRMQEVIERESVATGITLEVEELQRQNRDSFRIPEWFLYTSRAFLTLEGVSLQADPNYSIIKSCFPYVAKRLVADDDPRARKALKELIYGVSGAVDVRRLTDLADGFTSYTTTTKTINRQASARNGEVVLTSGEVEKVSKEKERKKRMVEAEATITLAKDSADILLAPSGNLVQDLLVEESALAASAQFKDAVRRALVDGPQQFRDSLPLGVGSLLPPLPFEAPLTPFLRKTPQEEQAQALAEKIAQLAPSAAAASGVSSGGSGGSDNRAVSQVVDSLRELDAEQAALVLKEMRENLPKYAPLMQQLGSKFVRTLLTTASSNLETALLELERTGSGGGGLPSADTALLKGTAQRLSAAARRGAEALAPPTDSR